MYFKTNRQCRCTVSQPNRQVAVFHGRTKGTASYDLRHADQMTITD